MASSSFGGKLFFFFNFQPHLTSALICHSSDRFDCSDVLQVLLNNQGFAAQVLLLSKREQWVLIDISRGCLETQKLLFCCNNPAQIAEITAPPHPIVQTWGAILSRSEGSEEWDMMKSV